MTISSREWVGRILDELKTGLGEYVVQTYFGCHPNLDWLGQIKQDLRAYSQKHELTLGDIHDETTLLQTVDVQGWLRLIWHGSTTDPATNRRTNIFTNSLKPATRAHAKELLNYRNDWAHQRTLKTEDIYYMAVIAARLLDEIKAKKQAETVREIASHIIQPETQPASNGVPAPMLYIVHPSESEGSTEPITCYPGDFIEFRFQGDTIGEHPLPVSNQRLIVGRSTVNSDIPLPDKKISRVHLQINRSQDNDVTITDLRSANGTLLNGQRIPSNTPVNWVRGQVVLIGSTELLLHWNAELERRTA